MHARDDRGGLPALKPFAPPSAIVVLASRRRLGPSSHLQVVYDLILILPLFFLQPTPSPNSPLTTSPL
jgi:hypothetical protein